MVVLIGFPVDFNFALQVRGLEVKLLHPKGLFIKWGEGLLLTQLPLSAEGGVEPVMVNGPVLLGQSIKETVLGVIEVLSLIDGLSREDPFLTAPLLQQ